MKHLAGLTASVLTLAAAFAGSAWADGIPSRPVVVAPPPPPADRCGYGPWTGFYVGGNLGWSGFDHNFHDRNGLFRTDPWFAKEFPEFFNGFAPFRDDDDETSFTGGGQIGYNFQCQGIVFGVEADLNWADHSRSRFFPVNRFGIDLEKFDLGRPHFFRREFDHDWFGTVRGRLGWANDRIMVYATAGGAYGSPEHRLHGIDFWGFEHRSDDDVSWGWTAGGGVEFLAGTGWTVKLEGLWIDWDDGNHRHFRPEVAVWDKGKKIVFDQARSFRFDNDQEQWVFRVGVNYLFGKREVPQVAPLK